MEKDFVKISLSNFSNISDSHDGFELDPTKKYIINIEDEIPSQAEILASIQLFGQPLALKNYHSWLFKNGFNVDRPNPTNEVIAPYFGLKPLWRTKYSQGIVVKAENDNNFYIVMECSKENEGYKHTKIILNI